MGEGLPVGEVCRGMCQRRANRATRGRRSRRRVRELHHESLAGRGTNTEIHTAAIFTPELQHSATAEFPAAPHERKQRCGLDSARLAQREPQLPFLPLRWERTISGTSGICSAVHYSHTPGCASDEPPWGTRPRLGLPPPSPTWERLWLRTVKSPSKVLSTDRCDCCSVSYCFSALMLLVHCICEQMQIMDRFECRDLAYMHVQRASRVQRHSSADLSFHVQAQQAPAQAEG